MDLWSVAPGISLGRSSAMTQSRYNSYRTSYLGFLWSGISGITPRELSDITQVRYKSLGEFPDIISPENPESGKLYLGITPRVAVTWGDDDEA